VTGNTLPAQQPSHTPQHDSIFNIPEAKGSYHQGTLSGHYDYLSLAIQFSIN